MLINQCTDAIEAIGSALYSFIIYMFAILPLMFMVYQSNANAIVVTRKEITVSTPEMGYLVLVLVLKYIFHVLVLVLVLGT